MKSQPHRAASTLVLSSITLAVLTMMNQAAAQQAEAPIKRVEVTGSSIKRLASEASLPVTTMKAEEFANRGMTTLADVMMALPQSASLAPSNAGAGTNVNLRGLGVNRTLVLLNGRRLANEAIADGYANLDVIPMSALARVEILRDGASSIYGSDAIGGVVNFITKRSFEGASATAQYIKPEKKGGGDEQRLTFTAGTGNLATDGWNLYATVDAHRRSALAARDRAELSTPELLTSIGRAPTLGSGGYAAPANFTTATNRTAANPYFNSGCMGPYSIIGAKNTCILNNQEYGMALYGNEQVTFYARGTRQLSEVHTVTLDYMRGQEHDPERGRERGCRQPAVDQQMVSGRQRRRACRGWPHRPTAVGDLERGRPRAGHQQGYPAQPALLGHRRRPHRLLGLQGWPGGRHQRPQHLLRFRVCDGRRLERGSHQRQPQSIRPGRHGWTGLPEDNFGRRPAEPLRPHHLHRRRPDGQPQRDGTARRPDGAGDWD